MDSIKIAYNFIVFVHILLYANFAFGQNYLTYEKRKSLPELATKQSIDNLRFISYNGKFTYYQKRTGELNLSTNYKVVKVLKGPEGTNYGVYSSEIKKMLIIEQDKNYHSFYGVRKNKQIYVSRYGDKKVVEIGVGISPKLHLQDTWLSFYNPQTKTIYFKNLQFSTFNFEIKIKSYRNPYFTPVVIMNKDGDIYYTDLSKKGIPYITNLNRKTQKSKVVYIASSHQFKLELCLNQDSLILGEFNLYDDNSLNMITILNKLALDFSKRKILYESPYKDFGNMICNLNSDQVFFIKNFKTSSSQKMKMEVARLIISSKKIEPLSDVNFATQIINMDGRLLLPYRGKFYLLLGENDLAIIDKLESKKSPEVKK